MKKTFIALFLIASASNIKAQPLIRFDLYYKLKIEEPSDLCFSADEKSLFMVSDRDGIYETDLKGNIKHSYLSDNYDLEAICLANSKTLIAADESSNDLLFISTSPLSLKETKSTKIASKSNSGIEAICRIDDEHWMIFQEKKPCKAFVVNKEASVLSVHTIEGISDISGASYYQGYLWLLSDEDASIYKVSLDFKTIKKVFSLPFSSAEGIAISSQGDLYVVSDSTEMLYIFQDFLNK